MKKTRNAFTLIELLVVVAIIGLLGVIVLASVNDAREDARITQMVSDLQQVEKGLTAWGIQQGWNRWPTTSEMGGGRLSDIANSTGAGEYISAGASPSIGDNFHYFRNGQGFYCSREVWRGASLYVSDVSQEEAEALDEIIDGWSSVNLNCGKIRWEPGYNGRLWYGLSPRDGTIDFSF